MTTKHYVKMAATFAAAYKLNRKKCEIKNLDKLVETYCETAREDNPRFDKSRFLEACKPQKV